MLVLVVTELYSLLSLHLLRLNHVLVDAFLDAVDGDFVTLLLKQLL